MCKCACLLGLFFQCCSFFIVDYVFHLAHSNDSLDNALCVVFAQFGFIVLQVNPAARLQHTINRFIIIIYAEFVSLAQYKAVPQR